MKFTVNFIYIWTFDYVTQKWNIKSLQTVDMDGSLVQES
jgi:hypothetical protein